MDRCPPEVLAPAGDEECLRAAVHAGADAVYFGLRRFSARARATNIADERLGACVRWLHEHAVRAYVTLNTLVRDDELALVEQDVRACAAAGVDALIVQDLGVARLCGAVAPRLGLHASTQMTCTDLSSIRLAVELGVGRVTLARELGLADIERLCAASPVPLEVFVHGALCISTSGQCQASSAFGGRSANRGQCAQACRLPYELVVDGVARSLSGKPLLLSPHDLEAVSLVAELARAGVSALKIEGRLKGADYVFAATRLYRRAVDAATGRGPGPSDRERIAPRQVFSRGASLGYLCGTDHQRLVDGASCEHVGIDVGGVLGVVAVAGRRWIELRATEPLRRGQGIVVPVAGTGEIGGRIWELRTGGGAAPDVTQVWLGPDQPIPELLVGARARRTHDPEIEAWLRAEQRDAPSRAPLALRLSGAMGEHAQLEGRSERDGRKARVTLDTPLEPARERASSRAEIESKLGKLGQSPFALSELVLELPAAVFLPAASLNRARRALLAQLDALAEQRRETTAASAAQLLGAATAAPLPSRARPLLTVLCRTLEQARAAQGAGADRLVLDMASLARLRTALAELRGAGSELGVALPRVRKPGDEPLERQLAELGFDFLLVRAFGTLGDPRAVPHVGDGSLHAYNRLAVAELLRHGLEAFTPSPELGDEALAALGGSPFAPAAEPVVYGHRALFHLEHCLFAARLSAGHDCSDCGRPCERHELGLRDRHGVCHPVLVDLAARSTVLHGQPSDRRALVPRLRAQGVWRYRVELACELAADVARIVAALRSSLAER